MGLCERNSCLECCLHAEVPLLNEDVNRIIMYGYYDAYFVQEREGVKTIRTEKDGRCIFFNKNTGLCDVYQSRPERCKMYPWTVNDVTNEAEVDHGCRFAAQCQDDPAMHRRMEKFLQTLKKEIQWRRETRNF